MNIVVIEPSLNDDFDKFYLTPPVVASGGSYFTRILYNVNYRSTPVFLHIPVCTAQKGYIKSGRRSYMDLMLNNSETVFVQWMENMESRCRALLYEKQDVWFDNKLEKDDIENAFNTCMKLYRSGKNIIMRVNVPTTTTVFDESGQTRTCESIDSSTSFTSILEVRGIKFSENAFQLELELKQIMVVPSNPFSSKCFLKQGVLAEEVVANTTGTNKSTGASTIDDTPVESEWIASAAAFLKSRASPPSLFSSSDISQTAVPQKPSSAITENDGGEVKLVMEGDDDNAVDMETGGDGEYSFRIEKNEVDIGGLLESDYPEDTPDTNGDVHGEDNNEVMLEMEEVDADETNMIRSTPTSSVVESEEWKRYNEMKRTVEEACRLVEEAKKNANTLIRELTHMATVHRIRDPSPLMISPYV